MMFVQLTLLSLIIVALGILGVILSFLVPDRKKSLISLILACLIILVGLIQLSVRPMTQQQGRKKAAQMRETRRADFEKLRSELQKKTGNTQAPSPNATGK